MHRAVDILEYQNMDSLKEIQAVHFDEFPERDGDPGEVIEVDETWYIWNTQFWQNMRGRNLHFAMQTRSNIFFWPLQPHVSEIRVEDIAHGLCIESRFSNTPPYPYSVAWHSYVLSFIVPDHLKKWALIHDATEAYLIDLPRPVKRQEPFKSFYEKAETDLMKVIAEFFGMEQDTIPAELKQYDLRIGNTELITLMGPIGRAKLTAQRGAKYVTECEELDHWVKEVTWREAKALWLQRYEELFENATC